MTLLKRAVGAGLLACLAAGPAAADHVTDQWLRVPDLTMRELVDQGFEIKSLFVDDASFLFDQTKYFRYVLQRGTEVYECTEALRYGEPGEGLPLEEMRLQCLELVAPFEPLEFGGDGPQASPDEAPDLSPQPEPDPVPEPPETRRF